MQIERPGRHSLAAFGHRFSDFAATVYSTSTLLSSFDSSLDSPDLATRSVYHAEDVRDISERSLGHALQPDLHRQPELF